MKTKTVNSEQNKADKIYLAVQSGESNNWSLYSYSNVQLMLEDVQQGNKTHGNRWMVLKELSIISKEN